MGQSHNDTNIAGWILVLLVASPIIVILIGQLLDMALH